MNRVLTVDPGETTGFSVWQDGSLEYAGQYEIDEFVLGVGRALDVHADYAPVNPVADGDLIERVRGVDTLVVEDWSLYPWELKNMAWDKCRTARAIGALQYIAQVTDLPFILQGANIKESAVAAGAEEHFLRPLHDNRHANDAIMHGTYYFLTKGDG